MLAGDFEGADVMSVYAAYAMTPNLSAELTLSQVFGNYSDALIASVSLVAQPFPEWRVSPFFSLGTGVVYTDPNVTLVDEKDRRERSGMSAIGCAVISRVGSCSGPSTRAMSSCRTRMTTRR